MDDQTRLEQLKAERDELEKAMPAHSLKPSHLARIEELEDEIEALEKQLAGGD